MQKQSFQLMKISTNTSGMEKLWNTMKWRGETKQNKINEWVHDQLSSHIWIPLAFIVLKPHYKILSNRKLITVQVTVWTLILKGNACSAHWMILPYRQWSVFHLKKFDSIILYLTMNVGHFDFSYKSVAISYLFPP